MYQVSITWSGCFLIVGYLIEQLDPGMFLVLQTCQQCLRKLITLIKTSDHGIHQVLLTWDQCFIAH